MFNRNPITRCADGWEISIQDSKAAYVSNDTVECGFPSDTPFTREFEELGESADGEYYPYSPIPVDESGRLQAIYPYVPYQVLWNELVCHGGVADDSPYKPYFLMKWAYEREAVRVLNLLTTIRGIEEWADVLKRTGNEEIGRTLMELSKVDMQSHLKGRPHYPQPTTNPTP